jgi:hypothetical protein
LRKNQKAHGILKVRKVEISNNTMKKGRNIVTNREIVNMKRSLRMDMIKRKKEVKSHISRLTCLRPFTSSSEEEAMTQQRLET